MSIQVRQLYPAVSVQFFSQPKTKSDMTMSPEVSDTLSKGFLSEVCVKAIVSVWS